MAKEDDQTILAVNKKVVVYDLFEEIEDKELRNRNQSIQMYHITHAHLDKDNQVTNKGHHILVQYFDKIPMMERANVFTLYRELVDSEPWGEDVLEKARG